MNKTLSSRFKKMFFIMTIVGPGLITVNAGNDAGGITTYASVGAAYGYKMLWGLLFITFSLSSNTRNECKNGSSDRERIIRSH